MWIWLGGSDSFFCLARCFGCGPTVLAFSCILSGLLALPLCGAALTFFAAAKKVSKESGLTPLARRCPPLFGRPEWSETRAALAA